MIPGVCRVTWRGQWLATIVRDSWGNWTVIKMNEVPDEIEMLGHLFEDRTTTYPPTLADSRLLSAKRGDRKEILQRWGVDEDDLIGQLIAYGGHSTDEIRFER